MAKGILYDPESYESDQLILIKKGDGVVTTEGSGTNTVAQGNSTIPIFIGGKYAGYTVKNLDPVRGVEVVVDDAGNTKWLPYNVNERLVPYLNSDGQLDLLGAVQGGITDPIDYVGWDVTQKEIEDTLTISKYIKDGGFNAQQAYDDGVELETIRTFASEFVPRQDLPTDQLPTNTDVKNEQLKPYVTESGGLDIFAAVANGITNLDEYKEFDVTQQDIDNIKTLIKYRTNDGRINVTQALKDGVDRAVLEEYFDISETVVTEEPKETAGSKVSKETLKAKDLSKGSILDKYKKGSKIDVVEALKAGVSEKELAKAGVKRAALLKARDQIRMESVLQPFITNGRADIGKAVAKLGAKPLQDVGIDTKTINLATISNKYTRKDGTFDTVSAIKANVTDATLKELGLSDKHIQDAHDIATMQNAGIDPDNYTLSEAIQKGVPDEVLYRWNDKASVDNAKKYVGLDKFYDANGQTTIESARSLGATDAQLIAMGFTADDIRQHDQYQTSLKQLTDEGYYTPFKVAQNQEELIENFWNSYTGNTKENTIDIRKLYDDGKLDLLLDVNPELTKADIEKLKNDFYDLDNNYVAVNNGYKYIAKSDFESLKKQMTDLGISSKEQASILSNIINSGNFNAYERAVQQASKNIIGSVYVTKGDDVIDYNYSGVKSLLSSGRLDSTLSLLGVEDINEWKQNFDDASYLNDYVNTKNNLQNRPNGTIDDYIYEAPQAVLDRVNRLYGTNYDHGKYADIYDRTKNLSWNDREKTYKELMPELNDPFSKESLGYVAYLSDRLTGNVGKNIKSWAEDSQIVKQWDSFWASQKSDALLKRLGISEEIQKKYAPVEVLGQIKDYLIGIEDAEQTITDTYLSSEVARTIPKTIAETTVNDKLLDPAIIIVSAAESFAKSHEGKASEGLAEAGSLLVQLGTYAMTVPNKIKKNPSQGIAEAVSLIIPSADIKTPLKNVTKAASYATFGKISDMTKAITSPAPDISKAQKVTTTVVLKGQKSAKTQTLPLATGKLQEVDVKGFKPDEFGNVVATGAVFDKNGQEVGYTRYRDADGNITVLLNAQAKNKWDTAANQLVWDTIQDVSHQNYLANKSKPSVTVVWGNYKVTATPTKGAKMSFVKGDKVHTVQATQNITPYAYSNSYKVSNAGVQVQKNGKEAPLIVVNNIKAKDYASDTTGRLYARKGLKGKTVTTTKTDYGEVAKIYAKDIAKTAAQVTKILLEPRFTKAVLKDVYKVINNIRPRTFEENFTGLLKLSYALNAMSKEDAAKVVKWLNRKELKKLLKEGQYAKIVEIIGLDKVRIPNKDAKGYMKAVPYVGYSYNLKTYDKTIPQNLAKKINDDLASYQKNYVKRQAVFSKAKKGIAVASIPIILSVPIYTAIHDSRVDANVDSKPVIGQRMEKAPYEFTDSSGKVYDIYFDRPAQSKTTVPDVDVIANRTEKPTYDSETKVEDSGDGTAKETKNEPTKPKAEGSIEFESKADVGQTKSDIKPELNEDKLNNIGKDQMNLSLRTEATLRNTNQAQTVNAKQDVSVRQDGELKQTLGSKQSIGAKGSTDVRQTSKPQTAREVKQNIDQKVTLEREQTVEPTDNTEITQTIEQVQNIELKQNIDQPQTINQKEQIPNYAENRIVNRVQEQVNYEARLYKDNRYENRIDPIRKQVKPPNYKFNIKPPRFGIDGKKKKGKDETLKKGTVFIAWRQGSLKVNGRTKPVWIVIRKKGNQLVKSYEYKTPEGASVTKGKAYQTLFHRGKKIRPFTVKVGFSKVTVDLAKTGKDRIKFERSDAYKYKLPTQRQLSRSKF